MVTHNRTAWIWFLVAAVFLYIAIPVNAAEISTMNWLRSSFLAQSRITIKDLIPVEVSLNATMVTNPETERLVDGFMHALICVIFEHDCAVAGLSMCPQDKNNYNFSSANSEFIKKCVVKSHPECANVQSLCTGNVGEWNDISDIISACPSKVAGVEFALSCDPNTPGQVLSTCVTKSQKMLQVTKAAGSNEFTFCVKGYVIKFKDTDLFDSGFSWDPKSKECCVDPDNPKNKGCTKSGNMNFGLETFTFSTPEGNVTVSAFVAVVVNDTGCYLQIMPQ